MKRTLIFSLICLALLLLLDACQGAGAGSPLPSFSTSSPGSNLTTPTKTTVQAPEMASSQIFVTNLGGEPRTIDPNKAAWAGELSVIRQCFDGLLGFAPDLSLKAVTAVEVPTVANGGISPDGLTYSFKLRPDVTWSDGQSVTARDYVYSILRMLSPEVSSEYASFYFDIAGAEAYNASDAKDPASQAALRSAVGVKALDDFTLQIKLARTRPVFLQLMALWPVYPLREDVIGKYGEKWTEAGNYLGNGPFILTEWAHQDHLMFRANPNYWGSRAKLTQLTFRMIGDANASLAAYKNNELQQSGVPVGVEKAIMADPGLGKEIVRYNDLVTLGFMFNLSMPPFDNLKVRQAFSCAVDRDGFVNQVRGGVGRVALSWIPPGMPGHDPNLGKEYEFNPSRARQLLAEAGYADVSKLPEIKFQHADVAGGKIVAAFLQGQIKANLGITITLDPLESKAFARLVSSGRAMWSWLGWGADYPDPDNWLPEIFGTGAGHNQSHYSNPAFDALAKQAKQELDNSRRLQLWAEAQRMVVADAPILTMYYQERFSLLKSNVQGFSPGGMDGVIPGDYSFRNIYLAK